MSFAAGGPARRTATTPSTTRRRGRTGRPEARPASPPSRAPSSPSGWPGRSTRFPPPDGRPVRMHLAGYPREEIAKLMGWTEAKTRNLLYRGLADLRERLTAEGIGWDTAGGDAGERRAAARDLRRRRLHARPRGPAPACPQPGGAAGAGPPRRLGGARLATLDHVMSCADCRAEFDLLRSIELARCRGQRRGAGRGRRLDDAGRAGGVGARSPSCIGRLRAARPRRSDDWCARAPTAGVTLLAPPPEATAGVAARSSPGVRSPGAGRYRLEVLNAAR